MSALKPRSISRDIWDALCTLNPALYRQPLSALFKDAKARAYVRGLLDSSTTADKVRMSELLVYSVADYDPMYDESVFFRFMALSLVYECALSEGQ